jgi:hypothetical protein
MKPDKKIIEKVYSELPRGYARIIQQRLLKLSIHKSKSYISQVLNPTDKRFNEQIFEQAVQLLEELKVVYETLSSRITSLNK